MKKQLEQKRAGMAPEKRAPESNLLAMTPNVFQ